VFATSAEAVYPPKLSAAPVSPHPANPDLATFSAAVVTQKVPVNPEYFSELFKAAVVPPPNAKASAVVPHPAKYTLNTFNPEVVAYTLEEYFSVVAIRTFAPDAPPNCNASDVVPHPANPNLAAVIAVVVA